MGMTVSTMQLGVCALYALILWVIGLNPVKLCGFQAPDKQALPKSTKDDIIKTVPVGFCAAAAHSSSVFALGGDPLFDQILKAACLPIIVGGVMFASLKKQAEGGYALKFDMTALQFGLLANCFAAFKGSESKKLMTDPGMKKRYGGVGNQYAVTEILAFLISLPVMFLTEGAKFGEFVELFKTSSDLQFNLVMSGMMFYLYNELATMTIKATGAVTASVANTAKRVIVLVYMAMVTGKALTDEQKIGAAVAIGGVLLYSVIDDLFASKKTKTK